MADVDFGLAIDALQARREAITLAAVERRVEQATQYAAQPAFWNFGAILGPISLDEARLGIPRLDGKALIAPELDHVRVDQLGRSEEQTSELQSLLRISYAIIYFKK